MPADEIEHERQPSKKRAHERNAVTLVDTWLGNAMRDLRTASGLSQRDVANRMTLPPNDTPHPIVANTLQRIDTEGESRTLDSQARKAVQRLEAAVQAPTGGQPQAPAVVAAHTGITGSARLLDRLDDLARRMTERELSDLCIHAEHIISSRKEAA